MPVRFPHFPEQHHLSLLSQCQSPPFSQPKLLCQFLKLRQGIDDCIIRYTVSQSHITRAGERTSRNHENIIFLSSFAERFFICHRGFHKEVECSLGFDTLESAFLQTVVQCQTILVICSYIHFCIYTFGNHLLHQGWGVDTSDGTVGNSRSSDKFFTAICFIRNYQITDTLSRKGQRFTLRIANNSIIVIFCQIWNFYTIISQLSVWLVRNQVNYTAKFLLFFLKNCS